MSGVKICDYKKAEIMFNEFREQFYSTNVNGSDYHNSSISGLKLMIDKAGKKKFDRIPVYETSYNAVIESEITSITDNGEVWVKNKSGRSKLYGNSKTYIRNANNKKIKEETDLINIEINKLKDKRDNLISELEVYKTGK
jgi:hypothetical protein